MASRCEDPNCGCAKINLNSPIERPDYRTFASGALRDADNGKLDYEGFLSPLVLRRFAQFMHKNRKMADGSVRDSDNWQKGIPRKAYMKSLLRHMVEAWLHHDGFELDPKTTRDPQNIEEVLCSIIFNAQGLLHEHLIGRDTGE